MKIRVNFDVYSTNHHGTQTVTQPYNSQTVHGWKLCYVDLLQPIKKLEKDNPEGGKTRAKWYKRFILYFPSGAWWHLDVTLL